MRIKYLDDVENLPLLLKFEDVYSVTTSVDKDFDVPLTEKHIDHWSKDDFNEHLHDGGLVLYCVKNDKIVGLAAYHNEDMHVNLVKLTCTPNHNQAIIELINYIERLAIKKNQNLRIFDKRYLEQVASLGYSNLGEYWIKKLENK